MILDTNAVSAFAANDLQLIAKLPTDRPWYLSAIVIGEFRFGILDSVYQNQLEAWIQELTDVVSILPVTENTATHYASIRQQLKRDNFKIPPNDSWIAALGIEHNLPILTRDSDFDKVEGIVTVGW